MLREANVNLVIVVDHQSGKDLEVSDCTIIRVKNFDFDMVLQSNTNSVSDAADPTFIAFTSGTTGVPKGIFQTQEAIVTMSAALAGCLGVEDSSRISQLHPYVFDVAIVDIGMCLTTGAAICLTNKGDMILPSAGELGPELARSRITHTTISPTMLTMLEPVEVPTLHVLSVMGEPLGRSAVQIWATCPSRTFYQLLGATEGCMLQTITTPNEQGHRSQNIGMALPGACRVWIADPDCTDALLEDGTPGEIVIESRALAQGYIGRSKETKKLFPERATTMLVCSFREHLARSFGRSSSVGIQMHPPFTMVKSSSGTAPAKIRGAFSMVRVLREKPSRSVCARAPEQNA